MTSTIGLLGIESLTCCFDFVSCQKFCILSESFWLSFQKFTLIPISRCQVAEDFSELDSDARSCSGLDSGNQLRSIYSKISNFYGSLIFPMFNSIDFIHRYFFPLPTSTARLLPSASPFSVSWMICNNNDKEIGHHLILKVKTVTMMICFHLFTCCCLFSFPLECSPPASSHHPVNHLKKYI